MPKSHIEHLEWSPSRMLSWGNSIGDFTGQIFKKLMDRMEHPELAYKSCLGIVRLEKRYGKDRLEKACERAIRLSAISYKSIKSILEKNLDGKSIPASGPSSFTEVVNGVKIKVNLRDGKVISSFPTWVQ